MTGQPLTVLDQAAAADLPRLFARVNHRWAEQLAEPETLDMGVAIVNAKLSGVADANQLVDAAVPAELSAAQAVRVAEEHFAAAKSICRQWTINTSLAAAAAAPLADALRQAGYRPIEHDILRLHQANLAAADNPPGVQIIPARASYRHVAQLAEEKYLSLGYDADLTRQLVESEITRLDDPHFDSLLALREGQTLGTVGAMAVGELGRLTGPWISPSARGQGLGKLLMSRVIDICARALFRHVFAALDPACAVAESLRNAGFVRVGKWVCYRK